MSEDDGIEFECIQPACKAVVQFSLRRTDKDKKIICESCKNEYHLDQGLLAKLKSFESLVHAVKNARDILSNTSVGVTVDHKIIKIPYKLLLTRMTTMLDLKIGNQSLTFRFRVEPLKEDEIKSLQ